ncbi:hypothetical protein JMM81_08895 [Bacillus sp. V3B]|uniref:hypothetical protein n=1 Tax=Bacillus sp. V3B TaxID=2804915 RepID=UPI0021091811|nr:hypothetical protein [Bacillus sp. V3B]MCQ6275076.1 hypothetical protein [Bacillus sp. V3B]
MLRLAKFFLLIGIFSLLLTACGTNNESDTTNESANDLEQTTDQTEKVEDETSDEQKELEGNNENKSEVDPQEQTDSDVQDGAGSPPSEQTVSYSFNGETQEEKALLQESDNQNFSFYILPAYELTAEEPYNDSVFLKENDRVFMRISILPPDSDMELLKENTTAQLQVVNETVQTVTPPNEAFLQNAIIMEASNDDGEVVTAYLIKNQESIIKLSLFTTEQLDHRDAFIQMAKTIKVGN